MIKKYISDYQALNIPDEKGLIADWHSYKFNPRDIKLTINNGILGDKGIKKRYIKQINQYLYVANFPRALADMIYSYDNIDEFYNCRNDYLTDKEEKELWKYLKEINKYKNIDKFLKYEFTNFYMKGM